MQWVQDPSQNNVDSITNIRLADISGTKRMNI